MGCSGSSSKDGQGKRKSATYNLTVTYTHEETSAILSVGALNETTIAYGLKGMIKLFNAKTKIATEFSREHSKRVDGIKFLSNNLLLTFGQDKLIKIWDINEPKSLMTFSGHTSLIWDAIELKDGRILSSGDDQKVLIWNIEKKALEFPLTEDKELVAYCSQLEDGTICITGGNSKKLMFWDLENKTMKDSVVMDQQLWTICTLKDNRLAIGCGSGDIKIFNPKDKTTSFVLKGDIPVCVHTVKEIEPGWLLSTTESNAFFVWNLNSPGDKYSLDSHESSVTDVCKIEDKVLVSVGKDKTLKIWC